MISPFSNEVAKAANILGKTAKQGQIKYSYIINKSVVLLLTDTKGAFRGKFYADLDRRLLTSACFSPSFLHPHSHFPVSYFHTCFTIKHTQISLHLQQVETLTTQNTQSRVSVYLNTPKYLSPLPNGFVNPPSPQIKLKLLMTNKSVNRSIKVIVRVANHHIAKGFNTENMKRLVRSARESQAAQRA